MVTAKTDKPIRALPATVVLAAAFAVAAVVLAAPSARTTSAGSPTGRTAAAGLDFVGQMGGASLAVEATTDAVYLGAGPTVRQLDPGPLTKPALMASSPVLEDVVRGLALHRGSLLVAAGRQGLVVLDPAGGLAVRNILTWTVPSYGVAAAGERAYVAVPGTGVMIVDPEAPSPVLGTAAISTVVGPIDARDDGWVVAVTGDGASLVDARDPVSTSVGPTFYPGARAVDLEGNLVLAAGPEGVRVYEMTGETAPRFLGRWTAGETTAVKGAGQRAFVGLADGTGKVLSLRAPSDPTEESAFRLAGWGASLAYTGSRLMAAINRGPPDSPDPYALGGGLEVLDDGGPTLTRRSLFEMPSGRLIDLELEGGEVWTVEADLGGGYEGRSWAVDLFDPPNPAPMGSVSLEGTPQRVAAIPPYGFVTTSTGLHVTRTTPDGMLRPVKFLPSVLPGPADLWAWGYHIWAVGGTDQFEVLDATYPLDVRSVPLTSNPDLMASVTVAVSDGRAYAAGENGLAVVDVRERDHPRTLARLTNVGPASGVAVWNHIALVANRVDGLRLVDARTVSNIGSMSHLEGPGLGGVAAVGASAYLLSLTGEVEVVDVSDPEEPVAIASRSLPEFAADAAGIDRAKIDAGRDLAVVAHPERGLIVYVASDVPGPTPTPVADPAPVFLPALFRAAPASAPRYTLSRRSTFLPINNRPLGFQVADGIAYVGMQAGPSDWLTTVDLSNPSTPTQLGRSDDLGGTPLRVAAVRGVAYVATGDGGLKVVDTTNPALPVVVGSFDTQADLMNVVLSPDLRHVVGLESLGGSGATQIVVYDVSDPSRPTEAGRLPITDGTAATGLVWPARSPTLGASQVIVTVPDGVLRVDVSDVQRPRVASNRVLNGAGEAATRRGSAGITPNLIGVVNRGSETVPGGLWLLDGAADGLRETGTMVSIDWPDVQGARQASWWNRTLVAASEDDLVLYDMRNPYWPRLVFELAGGFQDLHEVQMEEKFVYVSDPIDGFVVLDVVPDR